MSENTSSETTEQQIERAVTKKIISGVQSVSVDGMTTSFQSLDSQMKALSALKKMQASQNPLGTMKIFKVKSAGQ